MEKRYYSIEEANDKVQEIKEDIERMKLLVEELDLIDNTKIEFENETMKNYLLEIELNKNFHKKNLELYSILGNLIKEGCIVRDIENIEVEMLSRFGNREIVFCWNPEEEKIARWKFTNEEKGKRNIREIEKQYFEELKKMK